MIEDKVLKINVKNFNRHLLNHKSSILKLEDAYTIASKILKESVIDLKTVKYDLFFEIIKEVEKENLIRPYGKQTNAMMLKSLPIKFKIVNYEQNIKDKISEEDKIFLHSLNPKINTSFYFKNPECLSEDVYKLKTLNTFLNSMDENEPYISLNERSYELFGYEKCLSGTGVTSSLMNRTKVSFEDLHCFDTYTPLQCHIMHDFYKKEKRNILIIENLDTYWSFHRAMNETIIGESIDMLVYGCGNKSAGNFKFHRHYSITENDNIYYFGDVDPEGLAIYKRVKNANPELNIKLAKNLYDLAMYIGAKNSLREIPNKNQTILSDNEIDNLLVSLGEETAKKFKFIISNNFYVPQEAVNYRVLLEKSKKGVFNV